MRSYAHASDLWTLLAQRDCCKARLMKPIPVSKQIHFALWFRLRTDMNRHTDMMGMKSVVGFRDPRHFDQTCWTSKSHICVINAGIDWSIWESIAVLVLKFRFSSHPSVPFSSYLNSLPALQPCSCPRCWMGQSDLVMSHWDLCDWIGI